MKNTIVWDRKGVRCVVLGSPTHSLLHVMFGFPRGHPFYNLRRKHFHYRFKKEFLDRVVYAGWRTAQRDYWYIGLDVTEAYGPGGVGEAILLANRFVDSIADFTRQEQTYIDQIGLSL